MLSARALFATTVVASLALCQGPPKNGPAPADLRFHALTGATVVVKPGQRIENATLVLADGRVVSCSPGGAVPAGARVHDCTGLTIYPGLVEPFLAVDVPAPDADAQNVHWHPSVLAQRDPLDSDGAPKADRELLRSLGFCAAAIAPVGGNFRGTGAVVVLDEPLPGQKAQVVRDAAYHLCSLSMRFGGHPSSEMGAIALVRQVLADADWYASCNAVLTADPKVFGTGTKNDSALATLSSRRALPLAFDCDDELQLLRAARLSGEFERPMLAIGSGMEFRRTQAIAFHKVPVLVPVHFPEAPDVSTIGKQQRVSLRQLQSFEQAPTNLRRLLDEGVVVALTTARLPDKKTFRKNLAEALAFDVDRDAALAALTTTPAELLGCSKDLGTLENGRIANLVVVDGDLFDPDARIDSVFTAGTKHEIEKAKTATLDGTWTLTIQLEPAVDVALAIKKGAIKATIGDRKGKVTNASVTDDRLEFAIADEALGAGVAWVRARVGKDAALTGSAHTTSGEIAAAGVRSTVTDAKPDEKPEDEKPGDEKPEEKDKPASDDPFRIAPLPTPLGGFGVLAPPPVREVLILNATLWTSAAAGTVPLGALWIKDGRIAYAG
ncbi:MAG: amidohydrolase family protein, partial [Planctomycetota bacterium]